MAAIPRALACAIYGLLDFTLDPAVEVGFWAPVDLSYSYRFEVGAREIMLGIRAQNVFDEAGPQVPEPGFQPFIPLGCTPRAADPFMPV